MTSAVTYTARATTTRSGKIDEICAAAVDLARSAVTEDVPGDHVAAVAEGDRVVTHYFESKLAGYRGWRWAVTVARTPRSRQVTISETVLLPGPDALTPPDWVPWEERVRPGDLGVGDLMPTAPDDDRLVPGYLLSDDPAVEDVVWELGLGRVRVLSREGRQDTADRWYEGDHGPSAAISIAAPANARCVSCGFYLPLAGAMRQAFGVCANLYAPDDGHVVSSDHGCGAHSEVLVDQTLEVDEAPTVFDDSEVVDVQVHEVDIEPVEVPADGGAVPATLDAVEAANTAEAGTTLVAAVEAANLVETTEVVVSEPAVARANAAQTEQAVEQVAEVEVVETPAELGAPESAESTEIADRY